MNTPEQSIEQLQTQLVQSQLRRIQGRDYRRILRECNTPAQWYQASAIPRSIYFYDPQYQRYLQQVKGSMPRSNRMMVNQYAPRPKPVVTCKHHSSQESLPSRLQPVPHLPPIATHKKANDSE